MKTASIIPSRRVLKLPARRRDLSLQFIEQAHKAALYETGFRHLSEMSESSELILEPSPEKQRHLY